MFKVEKLASSKNEKTSDTVSNLLVDATKNISLTPEEYEKIARDTEEAFRNIRSGRRNSQANRAKGFESKARKTGKEKENDA